MNTPSDYAGEKRLTFLPFSRPTIEADDVAAVTRVLTSGWITTGQRTTEFEQHFCEYTGARHSIALTSATAGMHLLFKALNIGPGDEIITPSMTWVSTVNLIVLAGATPVFADIDRDTLAVTPELVAPLITARTRLIIPVHFAGASVDLAGFRELADQRGVRLIEDAAHALGAEYRQQRIGAKGTAIFSFHPIKNITTGEGGMFCTDDDDLAERIRRLKFHGLGMDAFDRETQGRAPQAEVLEPGFKYNLTDMASALGLTQLEKIERFNHRRRELARYYLAKLAGIPEIIHWSEPNHSGPHAWHLFIVRLDIDQVDFSRDEFIQRLKQCNIGAGLHFRAVHLQKYYTGAMGMRRGMLPQTEWNSDRICSLPLFPGMAESDVDDVVTAIKAILIQAH